MMTQPDLAAFLMSPVMIILGSADSSLCPEIARAVGASVRADKSEVELMVSRWQWPQTVRNVEANGRLAVTFARPSDYVSYQVKGEARVITASAENIALSARYRESIAATLEGLGLEPATIAPWLVDRDLVALRLSVREIFVQTPGAEAGRLVERSP